MFSSLMLIGALSVTPDASAHVSVSTYAEEVRAYPLSTCLATRASLEDVANPVVIVHEGQEYRFASDEAAQNYRDNPELLAPRLAEEIARADEG